MFDNYFYKPNRILLPYYATILMQEAQYDPATKFVSDGCIIIPFGLTTNQEDDSTHNN